MRGWRLGDPLQRRQVELFPNLDGLFYILELVQRPNRGFPPSALEQPEPQRIDADGRTKLGARSAALERPDPERIRNDPLIDEQTLEQINRRLRTDLPAKMDKARKKNDEAESENWKKSRKN